MTEPTRFNSRRTRSAVRKGGLNGHLDICSDPEFATHQDHPLAEPIKFGFWRNRKRQEEVRVTLSRYENKAIADVRIYFTDQSGCMRPTKKGIALAIAKLPELRKALEKAEAKAISLDLIEATS